MTFEIVYPCFIKAVTLTPMVNFTTMNILGHITSLTDFGMQLKNYLAVILSVLAITYLVSVMRFQSPLVYTYVDIVHRTSSYCVDFKIELACYTTRHLTN